MCLCNYFSHHVNFLSNYYLLSTFVKDGWFVVKGIDDNFQYFLSHISDDIFCLVLKSKKSLKKIRLSGQNDFVNWMSWTIVLRKTQYVQFWNIYRIQNNLQLRTKIKMASLGVSRHFFGLCLSFWVYDGSILASFFHLWMQFLDFIVLLWFCECNVMPLRFHVKNVIISP